MDSWNIVFAIGAAQAALLTAALWRWQVNAAANRVLAVWIALIGIDLALKAMHWDGHTPGLLKVDRFVGLFPFLYGSLFYVYVKTLTRVTAPSWPDTVHFAGFIIVVVMHVGVFFPDLLPTEWAVARVVGGRAEPKWFRLDILLYAYSLSYVVAGLAEVYRYRRELRQRRSDVDRMSLRWIDAMAASQIAIWSIAALHWFGSISWVSYPLIFGAVTAWVFVVGYLSLRQGAVVVEGVPEPPPAVVDAAPDADDPRFGDVEERLSELMDRHHLYREPALTIGQLAKRCGYPEYLVSTVINRCFKENFWEYINRQRVGAASRCLADAGDTRTILDIAYACGFTSKSTFNAAFKRHLGETPSAFRRCHAGAVVSESPSG